MINLLLHWLWRLYRDFPAKIRFLRDLQLGHFRSDFGRRGLKLKLMLGRTTPEKISDPP